MRQESILQRKKEYEEQERLKKGAEEKRKVEDQRERKLEAERERLMDLEKRKRFEEEREKERLRFKAERFYIFIDVFVTLHRIYCLSNIHLSIQILLHNKNSFVFHGILVSKIPV